MEVYLFVYNEDNPFTEMLYFVKPSHYLYRSNRDNVLGFMMYSYEVQGLIPAGEYSAVLCETKNNMIAGSPPDYYYYVIPRARITIMDEGMVLIAMEVVVNMEGYGFIKGVMMASQVKYDIRQKGVVPLLTKGD